MKGILKELVIEIEEVEEKVYDILKSTKRFNSYTKKFIEKKNFFVNILNVEDNYLYSFKIEEQIFNILKNKLKEINKECTEDENIKFSFLIECKYKEENGDYILNNYQILSPVEIIKYFK